MTIGKLTLLIVWILAAFAVYMTWYIDLSTEPSFSVTFATAALRVIVTLSACIGIGIFIEANWDKKLFK